MKKATKTMAAGKALKAMKKKPLAGKISKTARGLTKANHKENKGRESADWGREMDQDWAEHGRARGREWADWRREMDQDWAEHGHARGREWADWRREMDRKCAE